MASLADLFNPTFLMFLGILVLVVALLVVYFESKMREQNHKILSMLSLVSTLAEDMNGMKMGLNQLSIRGGNNVQTPNIIFNKNLGNNLNKNELIVVSDDEESDSEESDKEDSDSEESESEESDNESNTSDENDELSESAVREDNESSSDENNLDINNKDNIKVLKLNILSEDNKKEEINNFDLEEVVDMEADFDMNDELPEITDDYAEEILDLKYNNEENNNEENNNGENNVDNNNELFLEEHKGEKDLSTNLKTISINLGDEVHNHEDNIEYKKLQLPKLRSIIVEKGLLSNTEASKLKKPELLKLLGVE